MENTLENKAMFFAQYLNKSYMIFKRDLKKSDFLELKHIKNLSEIDIKYIMESKSINCNVEKHICENKIGNLFESSLECTDYLRLKEYAIPYMGLSVETMIEYGWIKLEGN